MKFLFLVIAILINLSNQSFLKSEEKIDSVINNIETITKKETISKDKTAIQKIHVVKIGDTITSISKLYSINKDLIIKLNDIKDKNYIYIGQNLIISKSSENPTKRPTLLNNYHIVQMGDNLTDISNKYKVNLGYLVEINKLKNPNSIKVGQKLLLSKNKQNSSENYQIIKNKKSYELLDLDKKIYGPITLQSNSYEKIKGRKVLNVLNQENKKLILSINCDTNKLDVRIPGRKWSGEEPANEEFEKNLINDFC